MTLLYTIIFPILFPIMTHGTIIFPIIFPIMTLYLSLFFLLFSIMTGFLHLKNGNVQTAILDPYTEEWLISVDEGCPLNCNDWKTRIENGKQPDAVFKDYYTHYFYYYAHYFYWLTRIPVVVITSCTADLYALILFVTTSPGNIREAAIAVWSAKTVPFLCYYFTLYHYYCNDFFN